MQGPRSLVLAMLSLLLIQSADSRAATTFVIEGNTDYTGNGCCCNEDLADDTSDIYSAMTSAGWTGYRYTTSSAWPQDLVENCLGGGGLDSTYGDTKLLSIFSGHGQYNQLSWGYPHNSVCTVNPSSSPMRLGENGGAQAGYFVAAACCVANTGYSSWAGWQHLWQIMGCHGLLDNDGGMLASFFNATSTTSNNSAWLNAMEDRPGWFTGDNSVIVYSYGTSQADLYDTRDNAKLKGGYKNFARGNSPSCGNQPSDNWMLYELRDHGSSGCY